MLYCCRTQAARDLWWNTLQDVLSKEKEKEPRTTNIQVTYYDLSTAIEYVSTEVILCNWTAFVVTLKQFVWDIAITLYYSCYLE